MNDRPTVKIRHSELKNARQCPLKWWLRHHQGWWTDSRSPSSALGTAWHTVSEYHFRAIQRFQQAGQEPDLDRVRAIGLGTCQRAAQGDSAVHETLEWMYLGYLEQYGLDEQWEIVAVEPTYDVRLLNPDGTPSRFVIPIHPDLIVRLRKHSGRIAVIDNKSTGQLLRRHDIDLDDQFGLYTWGLRRLWPDDPPLLPIINQVRTDRLKRPMSLKERFGRVESYRTPIELDEIEHDALATAEAMYTTANLEYPYSAPNPRSCGYSCEFKELHIAMRKTGRDPVRMRSFLHATGFQQGGDPFASDR